MGLIINGEKVDLKMLEREMDRLRPQYEQFARDNGAESSEEQLLEWSKENIMERTLLKQAASDGEFDVSDEDVKGAMEKAGEGLKHLGRKEARHEVETQLRVERLANKINGTVGDPANEEIERYYKANKDKFLVPDQVRVAHIVKHVTNPSEKTGAYLDISNAREKIRQGVPFEELASRNSDCPDNAGDLGYFGRGQMVQEFDDVVFHMKVGEVSDVFETQFGYHIAKLNDRRTGGPVPVEGVRDYISGQLTKEKQNAALEAFIDDLKSRAVIVDD